MATAYTDAQIDELKTVPEYNYEIATAFAEKHGISVRSVIAKVKSLEIPYKSKVGAEKKPTKVKARTKAEIVSAINTETGLDLKSLANLTLPDLETLEGYFKALAAAE